MRIVDFTKRTLAGVLSAVLGVSLFASTVLAQAPSFQTPPLQPSTFMASANFQPGALTAGDFFCITGSATRLIKIKSIRINGFDSTAQTINFNLIKRSAASTGGTATNPTAVPLDSGQVITTATATINAYSAVPTPGTAVGTISAQYMATSATGTITDDLSWVWNPQTLNTEPRLRTAAQQLCVNTGSAFTTAAPTLSFEIMWTEQ